MRNVIVPGLAAGVAMLVVGLIVNGVYGALFPAFQTEYETSGIFRPWSDPLMSLYFLYPFVTGIILAYVWKKTKGLVSGADAWSRGSRFGMLAWVVLTLPGMLITYASFVVSLGLVLSWTVDGFLELLVAGWVLARLAR